MNEENAVLLVTMVTTILVAPLVGAVLTGIDRRLTARMQGRVGPPILQPIYDVLKQFSKESLAAQGFQVVAVWFYLMSTVLSLLLVALGQDLLMMLFVLAVGGIAIVVGGFSVKSPYSQLGSQREVLQMLTYEPLLIFMVIGIYLRTGSFLVLDVVALQQPLIVTRPLFVLTMIIVMGIKLRKSPFDLSASRHAPGSGPRPLHRVLRADPGARRDHALVRARAAAVAGGVAVGQQPGGGHPAGAGLLLCGAGDGQRLGPHDLALDRAGRLAGGRPAGPGQPRDAVLPATSVKETMT